MALGDVNNYGNARNNFSGGLANRGSNFQNGMKFFPGNFVNSPNDIVPDAIPNDGTLCVFPQSDYQAIYARQWTQNGLTAVKYVPENMLQQMVQQQLNQQTNQNVEKADSAVSEMLYKIESRLEVIEKKLNRQNSYKKPYNKKKGAE